jgi:hypothetical protein
MSAPEPRLVHPRKRVYLVEALKFVNFHTLNLISPMAVTSNININTRSRIDVNKWIRYYSLYLFDMNVTEDILYILSNYSGGYKLMRARLHGYTGPVGFEKKQTHANDNTLRVTLSRLKERGLVKNEDRIWSITKDGLAYLKSLRAKKRRKEYPQHRAGESNMIISFDVPEKLSGRRDWLRNELVHLGFHMIQKSVWFGRAPLPKEFIQELHRFNLLTYIKFFKATEWDIV